MHRHVKLDGVPYKNNNEYNAARYYIDHSNKKRHLMHAEKIIKSYSAPLKALERQLSNFLAPDFFFECPLFV